MRTDSVIRQEGFQALLEKLNIVEAERFVTLLNRKDFDYTKWRENLWENMSVQELSAKAMEYFNENNGK